ncbi:putative membrane protein, putative efflux pump [Microthyrium microscopicum]|uniref:Putative membrane protein, putative efflux pump n=1 Tax=Microthyrium microscopicum TaxID=703497 RepID=A0A6A6UL65_9PEZI|nr:putative membrane protein, putative efflux pump [Microthyrium microscopicum]
MSSDTPSPVRRISARSPFVEASLATDIENDPDVLSIDDSPIDQLAPPQEHSLANFYRRPSVGATGSRLPFVAHSGPDHLRLTAEERGRLLKEERNLLRDSHLLPPKPGRRAASVGSHRDSQGSIAGLGRAKSNQDEEQALASETTPLLGAGGGAGGGGEDGEPPGSPDVDLKWEEAVLKGLLQTTWQREAKVLARNSAPLILTFLLQYSLNVASIFTVGHIGKVELGAVSLASMTASITGYSVYHGLVTSLDTLCAQAYGSGRRHLVGIQLQRMIYFLSVITVPIAIIWLNATSILQLIIPESEKETARLAGLYLKITVLGAPGYAFFEAGKRFMQAQGLFDANLYVLLICAPLNAFLNWLFVWYFGWGFIGAPIAVAITDNLLPLLLFLYVYFINGSSCWGGFSRQALRNWWPMIKLALPGLIMVLAEFLAFEILTLAASHISAAHLAAQSVLSTIAATTYQLPFPMSIAASTRIANFIGATLADAAKVSAKVAMMAACFIGAVNIALLFTFRHELPYLFTNDAEVAALVAGTLPVCIAFQLFDALAAMCNGILRGLGRQEIGGYVNLFAYYVIAMPLSFGTGFGLHWDLNGLWGGPAVALGLVAGIEGVFIWRTNWQRAVDDAQIRNAMG